MPLDPLDVLSLGLFLGVVTGVYGWLVGVFWSPFLVSDRVRTRFESLSDRAWWADYLLAIPVPAATWGFLFGVGTGVSGDLFDPGPAAPLYAAALDGVVFATVVSLLAWMAVLLVVLPGRGVDWADGRYDARTAALTLLAVCWYHLFLVLAGLAVAVIGGWGQVVSHSAA